MTNFTNFTNYLQKYCSYTTSLPSFAELTSGLERGEKTFIGESDRLFTTELIPEEGNEAYKTSQVRRIAAHLWGENETLRGIFKEAQIYSMQEYSYADNEPIKVTMRFPGNLEKSLFAKPYNERRFFGLELENILSPYKYSYSIANGIYEDEIKGIEAESIDNKTQTDFAYLEELIRIDTRSRTMLVGDMHDLNYLVAKIQSGNETKYQIRNIDPEKLFEIGDIQTGFVLKKSEQERLKRVLGNAKYNSVAILKKIRDEKTLSNK
jgi:hypothetical protein